MELVPLKYRKLATKYLWISGCFFKVYGVIFPDEVCLDCRSVFMLLLVGQEKGHSVKLKLSVFNHCYVDFSSESVCLNSFLSQGLLNPEI